MTLPPVFSGESSEASLSPTSGTEPSSELTSALAAVSDVLRETNDGRPVTSAGLKVSLQRRLNKSSFDKDLGFRTFRAFLNFAEAQGLIATRPTASDVYVYLASKAPVEPVRAEPSSTSEPAGGRLRADIWSAFVDFRPDLVRVYDRRGRQAWKLRATASEGESDAEATVRRRMEQQPDDFVQIPHVTRDEQLEWMREFAHQPHVGSEALQQALRQDRPLAAFAAVTRSSDNLREAWHDYLLGNVGKKVSAWASANDVSDDLTQGSGSISGLKSSVYRASPSDSHSLGGSEELLRRRIMDVLSELPLEDLLRLTVPIGSVLRR